MITFDENKAVFYLHTRNTTYAMGIFEEKVLMHLYWGKRILGEIPFDVSGMEYRGLSARDYERYSTDILPLEYSSYGSADLRVPSIDIVFADGSRVMRLIYKKHCIMDGKPNLKGLPSTYTEAGDIAQTLIITLCDELQGLEVLLSYTVYEDMDVITRNAKVINHGEKLILNRAMSMTVDFFGLDDSELLHLDGAWSRERMITRREIVHGNQNVESRYGASSAMHNPFIVLCERNATETHGNVYGMSLVYSGNFTAGVEMDAYGCARAYIGINPFQFAFVINQNESFQTPEAVLVYSDEGLGKMSRIYHRLYRKRLCRGQYRDKERFVLLNNWEATYFDFDEDKIVEIAKKAAEIGVDTMVLDDGWFGARNRDNAGLGDWYENPDKLPNGLNNLAKRINALGLRFGLWFEPEMVNPDSDLYRAHPDWVLHVPNRTSTLTRSQLTLDLSRQDVCDYIIDSVSKVLEKANIEYVKWDMNRYMTEVGSALLSTDRQGEVMHRYILGLYYVLETITMRFPNVLFESCASGGGRFDPGMLYYMPQVWTSDDSDAVERLSIQYGTSIVYPYSTMGAHVSACPNHQVGRTTPFEMRCNVAMPGQFGFELDLNQCTQEELDIAKQAILDYRRLQSVFHQGDCYRLKSPFVTNWSVVEFISEDKCDIVVCVDSKHATPNAPNEYIRLAGLSEKADYLFKGKLYGGDYLMNQGILVKNDREYVSERWVLKRIEN